MITVVTILLVGLIINFFFNSLTLYIYILTSCIWTFIYTEVIILDDSGGTEIDAAEEAVE